MTKKREISDLLASVDDVLGVGQAVDAGPPDDRVVPRGRVGHFHGAELQEGFAQGHATEQHLPAGHNEYTIIMSPQSHLLLV